MDKFYRVLVSIPMKKDLALSIGEIYPLIWKKKFETYLKRLKKHDITVEMTRCLEIINAGIANDAVFLEIRKDKKMGKSNSCLSFLFDFNEKDDSDAFVNALREIKI